VIFYTTLRAKENLHRFLCKFHTFECVKFTQHIRESVRESRSSGGMGPSLFTHCASFTTTMVTRGRGGGDGRGRGYIGGGNEINNDSVEQSRWKSSSLSSDSLHASDSRRLPHFGRPPSTRRRYHLIGEMTMKQHDDPVSRGCNVNRLPQTLPSSMI